MSRDLYKPNQHCVWWINVPRGDKVYIRSSRFAVEGSPGTLSLFHPTSDYWIIVNKTAIAFSTKVPRFDKFMSVISFNKITLGVVRSYIQPRKQGNKRQQKERWGWDKIEKWGKQYRGGLHKIGVRNPRPTMSAALIISFEKIFTYVELNEENN